MSADLLMEGADAYTSLAEVATADQIDTPEITPALTVSAIVSWSLSTTLWAEC
ncbi:LxmA leader domain family RiPP [Herbidospora yilanensis]|uniref:LxmA leader domain family RiPP n=1 Tax=Herbidospora yilanensis TaxID=354426 RepID=UPI000AA92BB6|nr:LxmA leader domain family RiPP [Herbidospora yilanensis]